MDTNKKNIFERSLDMYEKILPKTGRKKIISMLVLSFVVYVAAWISLALSLMSYGPIVMFSIIIAMIGISFLTLVPMLSVSLQNIRSIDSQSEEYRRDSKNKGKIYVNFGDEEGWSEFQFMNDSTTQSFKKLCENNGFTTEMGGEDEHQKKTRLRNNKIKDILG